MATYLTPVFAFDFSMNKPAMCCIVNNEINFYFWPLEYDDVSYEKLTSCDVHVINRKLLPIKDKSLNESELILEHVSRATNLAKMIVDTIDDIVIKHECDKNSVIVANEGFAFSASGDAVLDLSGYKYILMKELIDRGYKQFKTYSPITIKSTAGCAKKGMKKDDMINALGEEDNELHLFIHTIKGHNKILRKKTAYIPGIDDLTDAYWCLKTTILKEDINCILNAK